jgi:predicted MPP superfamily phosphohydrolase
MFHLYITLAYIIPNVYLFFRIMNLFISRGYKLWYTLVYLVLAAVYPLAEGRFDHDMNGLMQVLSTLSGYILPFYLYLFLSVLLFDLFLLFNLGLRILSSEIRKSFRFRFYTLSAMIILSILVVTAGAINLNTIRISAFRVEVPRKDARIDSLRIAFVADLHLQWNTDHGFVEQFVRKVNALEPDLMLYGGDMLEGDSDNESTEAIESALRSVQATYGAFGILGNHEFYGGGNEKRIFFQKAGIPILCDTAVRINDSFYLIGRNDQRFRNRKTMHELLEPVPHDLPVILLDHRPTELQEVSRTAVDIQFSGHTHHGQLFPINLVTRRVYELSWGYKKIRNTHFFVTSGLRLWGPPVKTAGKSEIMLVDVHFK